MRSRITTWPTSCSHSAGSRAHRASQAAPIWGRLRFARSPFSMPLWYGCVGKQTPRKDGAMTTLVKCLSRSLLVTAACALGAAAPAQGITRKTGTSELLISKPAHSAPNADASIVRGVSDHTPIYGAPTVLPITGRFDNQQQWLRVGLWGRPNGTTGWITADGTRLGTTPWVLTVSLSARIVKVYHFGRLVRRIKAVVGSPATPTPTGRFFIVEKVPQPLGSDIGPWALALNGYSNVLTQFGGGPGQIAIHGVGTLGAHPGEAASFGCIRVSTPNLYWLAHHLSAGVTVTINRGSFAARAASAEAMPPMFLQMAVGSVSNPIAAVFGSLFGPFSAAE